MNISHIKPIHTIDELEEIHRNGIPQRMIFFANHDKDLLPNGYNIKDFMHDLNQQQIRLYLFPDKPNYFTSFKLE